MRAGFAGRMGPPNRRSAVTSVTLPAQFTAWFPYQIYKDSSGVWQHTYDHAAVKPTGGTTYYVSRDAGSDSNDGLTQGTAFGTFRKAYTQATPGRIIMVESGNWPYSKCGLPLTNLKRDLAIECLAGNSQGIMKFNGCEFSLTWTSGGVANTWENPYAAAIDAWDYKTPNSDGDAVELLAVADAATVGTTPGSIFVQIDKQFTASIAITTGVMTVTAIAAGSLATNDKISGMDITPGAIITGQLTGTAGSTGTYSTNLTPAFAIASTTVYVGKSIVRTVDSRQPDDFLHLNGPSNFQIRNATGTTNVVWIKGLGTHGIQNVIYRVQSGFQLTCYLDAMEFKYTKSTVAAVQFLGTLRYITNSDGCYSLHDIYNDHVNGGFAPLSFSWRNTGRYGGYSLTVDPGNNNNIFTNHDSGSWIGGYDFGHHSKGPIQAFVDNSPSLTTAVLFGCSGRDSTMDSAKTIFTVGAASGWLLDCSAISGFDTCSTTSGSGHINLYHSTPPAASWSNNGSAGVVLDFATPALCLAAA